MEQRIQEFLIGQKQGIQIMGHGEDDVEVLGVENLAATLIDPEILQDCLAVGAVTVAAGRVVDLNMAAFLADTGIDAKAASLALPDGIRRAKLLSGDIVFLQKIAKGLYKDLSDRVRLSHKTPSGTGSGWDTS